ncbi:MULTISPECIES: VPLPA-CTERM sorting domain-containing protein [Rhodobacterales]|uniref:VPLPA-CTERM sorting domain-containing protein n=1 Tax=Rhodobacterales TaxID=204455 RepID=UPI0032972F88
MNKVFNLIAASTLALGAGTVGASAALLDFTSTASYDVQSDALASGTINGIGWTLTPSGGDLTFTTPGPGSIGDLVGDNDGIGVDDDEITLSPAESVTLTFDKAIRVTGLYFLDLFISSDGAVTESAVVSSNGSAILELFATENEPGFGLGDFTELAGDFVSFTGTSFTFTVGNDNDNVGKADFALAGIEIAPIPLPAGILLLGTALGGLGIARRRKKA